MIDIADRVIESSHAAETGSQGDLHHGEFRFVDELFSKVQPTRLHNRLGRRPKVPQEQASQMARAHTQAFG
jgi:hypothetical protein